MNTKENIGAKDRKTVLCFCVFAFLLCLPSVLRAQEFDPNENRWMEYLEELTDDSEDADENSESLANLYNELSYLAEHPLNLNTVTLEQLKQIPFLSDIQIFNILDCLKKNGQFVSIYELKNIPFLDLQTIELILPFLYVGQADGKRPFNLQNLARYGKNELMLRYDRTLEQKAGYKDIPDSILQKYPNRKYLGEPFYTSLRYSYTFDDRLQAGLTAEKDAGESFMQKAHRGYDFYSVHLFLKNLGRINALAVGDYKISFGQGLVVSNDFRPSRSSVPAQAERRNYGFRRHYSVNENDFFRGIASTVAVGQFDVSAFYSSRSRDATVTEAGISSFKTDGMHRTAGDMEKRHNVNVQTAGGNVRYISAPLTVGVTALTYSFGSLSVEPESHPYNLFYFRGERNTNLSVDYTYRNGRAVLFGETAASQNGALATLNALKWDVSAVFNALILYRNYGRAYHALYGSSFSQNAAVQNEEGVYLSLQWSPVKRLKMTGYADFYRFPWLKYNVDAPSSGREYMIQADCRHDRKTTLSLRYRYRRNERNALTGGENLLLPADQHRLRLQASHCLNSCATFRTVVEGNRYLFSENSGNGFMISQSFDFKHPHMPLRTDISATCFSADNYNSRVYPQEKHLLYSASIPSFYGEGMRLTAVVHYSFARNLSMSLKAAWTRYFDRDSSGSGLEEIDGKNKIDVYAQARWLI